VWVGLIPTGPIFAAIDNRWVLPGYTRADGAVYYFHSEKIECQVNLENLHLNTTRTQDNGDISREIPISGRVSYSCRQILEIHLHTHLFGNGSNTLPHQPWCSREEPRGLSIAANISDRWIRPTPTPTYRQESGNDSRKKACCENLSPCAPRAARVVALITLHPGNGVPAKDFPIHGVDVPVNRPAQPIRALTACCTIRVGRLEPSLLYWPV